MNVKSKGWAKEKIWKGNSQETPKSPYFLQSECHTLPALRFVVVIISIVAGCWR